MRSFILLLVLALFFIPSPALAESLNLETVLTRTKATHPAIDEAKWDYKAAERSVLAKSWLEDPRFSLMFDEVPLNTGLKAANMTNYSVSQKIPFSLPLSGAKAASETKAKLMEAISIERKIIAETKKTFFELFAIQKIGAAQKNALHALKQLSAGLQKKYESFKIPTNMNTSMPDEKSENSLNLFSELTMARMKAAEMEANLADSHHLLEALKAKLNLLMGLAAENPLPPLLQPTLKKVGFSYSALEEKLKNQNADLKSQEWMVKASKNEAGLAKMKLLPEIEPEFTYQQRDNMENAYSVGINLNLPLWLHRNESEISSAKAMAMKSKRTFEKTTLEAKNDLHNLYHHAVEHYRIVLLYQNEIVPLAKASMHASHTALEANATITETYVKRVATYYQAIEMMWKMWVDYQTEYAFLEVFVGENL